MTVTRDDEMTSPSSLDLTQSYYVTHGVPAYATPLYYAATLPDGLYAYPYPTAVSPHFTSPHNTVGHTTDHTDIMSMIPTLRCWSCSKCGNLNYAHRLTCNLRKCQRMSELNTVNSVGAPDTSGDWVCACGNINYRFRKYCNLRKCQLPQIGNPFLFYGISQLIKAGYAPQTALSLLLTNSANSVDSDWVSANGAPPHINSAALYPRAWNESNSGCWQCVECGNLNWPWRQECNRKGCAKSRKDIPLLVPVGGTTVSSTSSTVASDPT